MVTELRAYEFSHRSQGDQLLSLIRYYYHQRERRGDFNCNARATCELRKRAIIETNGNVGQYFQHKMKSWARFCCCCQGSSSVCEATRIASKSSQNIVAGLYTPQEFDEWNFDIADPPDSLTRTEILDNDQEYDLWEHTSSKIWDWQFLELLVIWLPSQNWLTEVDLFKNHCRFTVYFIHQLQGWWKLWLNNNKTRIRSNWQRNCIRLIWERFTIQINQ